MRDMNFKYSVTCFALLAGLAYATNKRAISHVHAEENLGNNFRNHTQKLLKIRSTLSENSASHNSVDIIFGTNAHSQLNDWESIAESVAYLTEVIKIKCEATSSIHEAVKVALELMFKHFAKVIEDLPSTFADQASYLEGKECISDICTTLSAFCPAELPEFADGILAKFSYFRTKLEKLPTEKTATRKAEICFNFLALYFQNSVTDSTKLRVLQFLAPVIIPEEPSSETITEALYALSTLLHRFQLSVFFSSITFQQIFSAYHLQDYLVSNSSLSPCTARLLGNLGFSILYKRHEKSPKACIRAYRLVREFISESCRQSMLEHFLNVYPQWSSKKQDEFIGNFGHICNDIKTVQLATSYHQVMGNRIKEFLGFVMLQTHFNDKEIRSFMSNHNYVQHSILGLNAGFIKFPQSPRENGERIVAWTANQTLLANLPLNTEQKAVVHTLNDIEFGDAEAIHDINVAALCKLLKSHEWNCSLLIKWVDRIWSKLGPAGAQRLVENSRIPLSGMLFSARIALAPRSVLQYKLELEEAELLAKFLYKLADFSPSDMMNEFEQALQFFVKGNFPRDDRHHRVLMGALHFYSVKEDLEMVALLNSYFLEDSSWILNHLCRHLPKYSPVWTGCVGVVYANFKSNSYLRGHSPTHVKWAISDALLRNDMTFLCQLNVPASRIINVAHECGAIPLLHSEEQLAAVLSARLSDESKGN